MPFAAAALLALSLTAGPEMSPKARAVCVKALVSNASWALGESNVAEAREYLDAAVGLDPKTAEAFALYGRAFALEKNAAKAEESYRKALELSPALVAAHVGLAEVLAAKGEKDKALASLTAAADKGYDNAIYLEQAPELAAVRSLAGYKAVRAKVDANAKAASKKKEDAERGDPLRTLK